MRLNPIHNKATMATTIILNGPDQGKVIWNAARDIPMVVTFRAAGIVLDRIRVVASTDEQAIQRARVDTIARCQMHGLPMPMIDDATASIDTSRIKAGIT